MNRPEFTKRLNDKLKDKNKNTNKAIKNLIDSHKKDFFESQDQIISDSFEKPLVDILKDINKSTKSFITEHERIVSKLSKDTREETELIIDTYEETIVEILSEGEKINLQSYGIFESVIREPYEGKNPQTGSSVPVGRTAKPKFTFSKVVKDILTAKVQ